MEKNEGDLPLTVRFEDHDALDLNNQNKNPEERSNQGAPQSPIRINLLEQKSLEEQNYLLQLEGLIKKKHFFQKKKNCLF